MSEWIKKLAGAYSEVNENTKAQLAKTLAKSAASSEKGKAAVTLPKAPFDIPKKEATEGMSSKEKMAKGLYNGKMDPVDKDELKGKHADRDDKDIDNDGDADKSDEYLHKKRKAISKNMKKEGDEEIVMNPKKEKKTNSAPTGTMEAFQKGQTVMPSKGPHAGQPHEVIHDHGDGHYNIKPKGLTGSQIKYRMGATKAHKSDLQAESTIPAVYARIIEARGAADKDGKHYKSAADGEEMDSKDSPGAKQMRKDHEPEIKDNPEEEDQMAKAVAAVPAMKARKGDNAAGDKKIIPSATPAKG